MRECHYVEMALAEIPVRSGDDFPAFQRVHVAVSVPPSSADDLFLPVLLTAPLTRHAACNAHVHHLFSLKRI